MSHLVLDCSVTAVWLFEDERTPMTPSDAILALGREHGLSSYDAAYLELAVRYSTPVATLDVKLANAAQASGTGVWRA